MGFNDKKVIALLLFIVIISFSIFSEYKSGKKNGFKEGLDDDDVPDCTDEDVPYCSHTVNDEDSYYGTSNYNDLLFNAVPESCPACPTVLDAHTHHSSELDDNTTVSNSITGDDSTTNGSINQVTQSQNINNLNQQSTNVNQQSTNTSNVENTEQSSNETTNITNTNVYNTEANTTTNNSNPQENVSNTGMTNSNTGMMNSSMNGNTNQKNQDDEINRLKGEISRLKQQSNFSGNNNDHCPPCPSCERCPEPAFTCEKKINYRSPNVGNYLPMPLLNDFSSFDNNKP